MVAGSNAQWEENIKDMATDLDILATNPNVDNYGTGGSTLGISCAMIV